MGVLGARLGNTATYDLNPCTFTVRYYARQIQGAVKTAFTIHPEWEKPGSSDQAKKIVEIVSIYYNPFKDTEMESELFDSMWQQTIDELQTLLMKRVPKKISKCR